MTEPRPDAPPSALIVGAGGLGGILAALLAAAGRSVTLVARGDHARALRESGLLVEQGSVATTFHLPVVEHVGEAESFDVAIVTVKATDVPTVARSLVEPATSGSAVVSFVNGVEAPNELLQAGVPPSALVAGAAYVTAFKKRPGEVVRSGTHGRLVVGPLPSRAEPEDRQEPKAAPDNPRSVQRVVDLFSDAAIAVESRPDMSPELWEKMAVVSVLSALCAPERTTLGAVRAVPGAEERQRRAIGEVLAVAAASGVFLASNLGLRLMDRLDAFPDEFYPSVVHDLRRGRRSEMQALCGSLVRRAADCGLDVPILRSAVTTVAELEGRSSTVDSRITPQAQP